MKRNDFVTNVLKCNNFHCLASSEASVSKFRQCQRLVFVDSLASSEARHFKLRQKKHSTPSNALIYMPIYEMYCTCM